uniref:uncharacterized protein LOC122601295 n=1 Tax=Erigeron canadensis TaxID=72917 RepID=UPI001CB9AA6F|nr:uncharacterized protein LOC122601295 [Erigeron canadensis]
MKAPMRCLLFKQGNLHVKVSQAREDLDEVQHAIDGDPLNPQLQVKEVRCLQVFRDASMDEEMFLKQKSKIEWLKAGDSNSSFFHNSIKCRNHMSRIAVIKDANGTTHEGGEAIRILVDHYSHFLGSEGVINLTPSESLFTKRLSQQKAKAMIRRVSDEEMKAAMFAIGDNKAPGPDGFSSAFFKEAWEVVGKDVSPAIHDLFCSARMLQEINHTFLALVPKNYHRNVGPPRCTFKIEIQKAYDTVDWGFLKWILVGFGFHPIMINWIIECVTTTSFSLSINGNIHGYFKGGRGLRQGDPMSPYLFTLVMEVLTLLLHKASANSDFRFHNRCEKQGVIDLCFADDLFIFARGEANSARIISDALNDFQNMSGLVPSLPKSTVFLSNVPNHVKNAILEIMPFEHGELPVKYLGVPLVSSRLLYKDCKILVEKMENRITNWRNKFLSFAGRLQLMTFGVLSSLHVYWASMFILPSRVINDLEKLMRAFIWSQGPMKKGKAKTKTDSIVWKDHYLNQVPFSSSVVWESICDRKMAVPWAKLIWNAIKGLADMAHLSPVWADIMTWMIPRSHVKFARSVLITSTVRMKLATLRFKNSTQVERLLNGWLLLVNALLAEDEDDA